MHGAASAENVENRSASGARTSTDATHTQGQTQDGRSAQQQQTPVQPTIQLSYPVTEATSITSRQVTGSDVAESAQPQKGRCISGSDLSGLRFSATRSFFMHIEAVINTRKPGMSETGNLHNPEAAGEYGSDSFCVFGQMIEESFKKLKVQQEPFEGKNTLPLCLAIIKKTIKDIDGLIEEMGNARRSMSSGAGIPCNPEPIEELANAIRGSFRKLETNERIWTQHEQNNSRLCQAIVRESLELGGMYGDYGDFIKAVIGPVYMLALNGALESLMQRPADQWTYEYFCLLVDLSQRFDLHNAGGDLLSSNLIMLDDLFKRSVSTIELAPLHLPYLEKYCANLDKMQQARSNAESALSVLMDKREHLFMCGIDDSPMGAAGREVVNRYLGNLHRSLTGMLYYLLGCEGIKKMTR